MTEKLWGCILYSISDHIVPVKIILDFISCNKIHFNINIKKRSDASIFQTLG